MKKTIGKKNKVYLLETSITTLLILFLITLCVYRTIKNENGTAMLIVFIGLSLVCLYWLYIQLINIYYYLKTPNDIVLVDSEFIYINEYKNTCKVRIDKVKEIKVIGVVNKILAHEATLYIKDEDNEYKLKLIKNPDEIKRQLEEIINGISIH